VVTIFSHIFWVIRLFPFSPRHSLHSLAPLLKDLWGIPGSCTPSLVTKIFSFILLLTHRPFRDGGSDRFLPLRPNPLVCLGVKEVPPPSWAHFFLPWGPDPPGLRCCLSTVFSQSSFFCGQEGLKEEIGKEVTEQGPASYLLACRALCSSVQTVTRGGLHLSRYTSRLHDSRCSWSFPRATYDFICPLGLFTHVQLSFFPSC